LGKEVAQTLKRDHKYLHVRYMREGFEEWKKAGSPKWEAAP
jgi:hypothetical protein